uniref:Peroxisomal membrane protein PEX16 n=1 Tax=Phallusia mammillata TaxID=59560 RepID=A0A6F9DMY0_9ASCI|nr:peroxisomal membrane protein PEX16-like [Phallusia mammillata]
MDSQTPPGMVSRMLKMTTVKLTQKLSKAKAAYVGFVGQNPEMVEQIEKSVKAAAYLYEAFSKNYDNSIFITELVASACNLFGYVNANVRKTKDFFSMENGDSFVGKLQQVLTVVEFSQAFLEMTAARTGGPGARWAVISIICLVKVILRCILLLIFECGIHSSSLSLNLNSASVSRVSEDQPSCSQEPNVFYVGPRSGHRIRTLDSCDQPHTHDKVMVNLPPTILNRTQIIGELLYSVRPMVHLLASAAFGTESFIPWVAALVSDTTSHVLLNKQKQSSMKKFNPIEEKELQRRYANLLLYLLRSPMFDKTTGPKLLQLFAYMSKNIPLARYIFDPLSSYLPAWQKVYFYTWAD